MQGSLLNSNFCSLCISAHRLMSGFFTIGVMTVFAGYLTKLYTKKGTRNIAQYAQFVFPTLFPLLWVLTTRLPREGAAEKLTSV